MQTRYTLVLGASLNPERYSYLAIRYLQQAGLPVLAIGNRGGQVGDTTINTDWNSVVDQQIDTITLYLGARNQIEHYDQILASKPRRIIFNPGAENPELKKMAQEKGIETLEACTLVMIQTHQY